MADWRGMRHTATALILTNRIESNLVITNRVMTTPVINPVITSQRQAGARTACIY